jgi:hypothetical protein
MEFPFPHQIRPQYTAALRERRAEGVIVPPAQVSIGDWEPLLNQCHENVTTWCANNTEFQIVRGWLYLDFSGQFPYEIFLAHSVVRDKDGALWDITPMQAFQQYPFIAAIESEEEYAAFVEQGVSRLAHYKQENE